MTTPDVVIVGAGPVGLALAIELGGRGVRCLVVERNARVGHAPRAKTTNVRTRTHMRRWGIADQLSQQSPLGVDYPTDIVFVTRLAGHALARIENAFNAAPEKNPLYPEHAQWVPQYKVEQVLRAHVATLPLVTVAFDTEYVGFEATADGVRVHLRDGGGERGVAARYLVGADGARSSVRDAIGASMSGAYGLSRNYNIVFRAPGLAQAHGHGPGVMYWQVNASLHSIVGPMDQDDIWFFMPTDVPPDWSVDNAEAPAIIAAATGIDLPYEVLSSDVWVASRLIADKYRDGRVLLAGDACHLHPPFGGFGMNMGVSDAVDLGWKLAAVLQGWGGEALLASYESERRPVHEFVMDEAEANHAVLGKELWAPGVDEDGPASEALRQAVGAKIVQEKAREFQTLGVVLGYRYADSPIICTEERPAPHDPRAYAPSSHPGCLAPHAWVDAQTSLYDLFGQGFTLLFKPGAEAQAALDEASATRTPLTAVALPESVPDHLYPFGLTLVRPDQHVCWRGDAWQAGVLDIATGRSTAALLGAAERRTG